MVERKATTSPAPVDPEAMKRLAIQQSIQLPRDYAEAMAVLGYMTDIVKWQAGLVAPSPVRKDDHETVVSLTPQRCQRA
jgi:hypothetical protein